MADYNDPRVRGCRLACFQVCQGLMHLMEEMLTRGLKVVQPEVTLQSIVCYISSSYEDISGDLAAGSNYEDSDAEGNNKDKIEEVPDTRMLTTVNQLLDQCQMLVMSNDLHLEHLVGWRSSALQDDKSHHVLARTINDFIMFALHINTIYCGNFLTANGVKHCISRAILSEIPESEFAAKHMFRTLTTMKALWTIREFGNYKINVGNAAYIPPEVAEYLGVWYHDYFPLPFSKVFQWYLNSTQRVLVEDRPRPPVRKEIENIVSTYFPAFGN